MTLVTRKHNHHQQQQQQQQQNHQHQQQEEEENHHQQQQQQQCGRGWDCGCGGGRGGHIGSLVAVDTPRLEKDSSLVLFLQRAQNLVMWAEVGESACVVSLSLPWQLRVLHKQGLEAPSDGSSYKA
mmetsp:Transcript_12500/g.24678  ORF Transcript_12500/g.24678 Transcript_12500/m.24678 type:complete len:126 (+) Transcript_12500:872-1249(+)